jgi:hypothetical protein
MAVAGWRQPGVLRRWIRLGICPSFIPQERNFYEELLIVFC